jgi:prephenate dehydrogenase
MGPGFKTRLAECRVGVIGLGLMGGSLALALQSRCRAVAGYDVDPGAVEQALNREIIGRPINPRGDDVDLVILAAPVSAILDWLNRIPQVFPGEFHLLDLGSTKTLIVERMHSLPARISPLGGHPMCGKESSGLSAADRNLYQGCLFALTPLERTHSSTLNIAQELIAALQARPLLLDPQAHDRAAAAISHLPYLSAATLVDAVMQLGEDLAWELAASGFRDTSRLAASDITMLLDILKTNRAEVLKAMESARLSWQETLELIEREDWAELRVKLDAVREKRLWWEKVEHHA